MTLGCSRHLEREKVVGFTAMEEVYSSLTTRALQIHTSLKGDQHRKRAVIALAGPPGCGKTTIATEVVQRLNKSAPKPYAVVLPMDGFHLPRATLDTMPNREEAYARRGAAWTFDAEGVLELVTKLHESKRNRSQVITAPAFDHAGKDPVHGAITIAPEVSLVILEGNWLLYDQGPWSRIAALVDDTWYVDVEPALARDRVAKRHLKSGIEETWEAAVARAEGNDLLNGEEVRTRCVKPAVIVESIEVQLEGLSKVNGHIC